MGKCKMRKIVLFLIMCLSISITKINVFAEENETKLELDAETLEIEYEDDFLLLQVLDVDSISWKVEKNREKRGKKISLKKNQEVKLRMQLSNIQNVKVGIVDESGERICTAVQKNIYKSIAAKKAGKYHVFVQNKSGKAITVSGNYSY